MRTRMHAAISTELYRTKLSRRAPSKGTACLGNGCRTDTIISCLAQDAERTLPVLA